MARDPERVLTELIARAKEGDRWAYGHIFRLCYKSIYDYTIRRVGDRNDAEDITMRVFMQGLDAVASYEERGCSVRAWFFRIAHNAVVDHLRAHKSHVDIDSVFEVEDATRNIESELVARETIDDLHEKIKTLPPAQAEVVILRFIEDLSVTETATVLGKKEVTVRALQFKAIKSLKEKFAASESQLSVGYTLNQREYGGS
jgi:RNA polymerase sigma-70 factor (ECF subfamily)